MSTLWTPSGEHRPPDHAPAAGAPPGPEGAPEPDRPGPALDEAQVRAALEQLAATPVSLVVADHAARLHELALLHLGRAGTDPHALEQASLAIDAVGALVEGLGSRLDQAAAPLAEALSQLRLAYVQVRAQVAAGGGAPGGGA